MAQVKIEKLSQILTKKVPSVRCIVSPLGDQIAVEFKNRNDLVIHLLTPYYQNKLKNGGIPEDDIPVLIDDVKKLAEKSVYSDIIMEDLNSWFEEPKKITM